MANRRQMQRAEYKRRRTVAIKMLRKAGLSEQEIQDEIAKIRDELGIDDNAVDAVIESTPNLPAVIDSGRHGRSRRLDHEYPERPGRDKRNTSTIKENVAQHDSLLADNPERRCVATNSLGEPCRNFAIKNAKVCRAHGGSTRMVKEAARVRVEMASMKLMGKLIEIAFDDTRPSSVQLDAIKDSLNRAGLKPPEQVEVGPIKPFEQIFDDISNERPNYAGNEPISGLDFDTSAETLDSSVGQHDSTYSGPTNYQAGQSNPTEQQPQHHTATRDTYRPEQHADSTLSNANRGYSGDDRPPGYAEMYPDRYRMAMSEPITGEDAIWLANKANRVGGDTYDMPSRPMMDYIDAKYPPRRALPPGRS